MSSRFFAFLSRMKYIDRWGLMRSTIKENVAEHSLQVAWVAHALAVIENKFFGGRHDVCRIGMIGAYHETGEVITGDMPTPIKYFSPEINYEDFASLVQPSEEEKRIVKYADKLTAYIKCVEETTCNNSEFSEALRSTERELRGFNSSAVDYFMDSVVEAYKLTLDGLAE